MSDWDLVTNDPVVDRYVRALYDVSVDAKQESQFLDQIEAVYKFIGEMQDAEKALKRFSLLTEEGYAFVSYLSEKLNLLSEIENFLKLILKNKRFSKFLLICKTYISFVDKKLHDKKVFYVTHAGNFSDKDQKKLIEEIKDLFGGEIECKTKKDESLIDGLQIRYRSKILDYSMKSKLNRLDRAMRGDRYED